MFLFRYAWREWTRRWGRTLGMALGLGLGVAVVVVIISFSQGLREAQRRILSPLAQAGTDLVVTRSPFPSTGSGEGAEAGPMGGFALDPAARAAFLNENQVVTTDLSQLGNPGERFRRDLFLPGTLLPFGATELSTVSSLAGVVRVDGALLLTVIRQEGTLPTLTAEVRTGGEQVEINEEIAPLTEQEQAAIDQARTQALNELRAAGIDPASEEGRRRLRQAMNQAFPERFQRIRRTFFTPERIIRQQLDLPVTDLTTQTFSAAGVPTGTETPLLRSTLLVTGRLPETGKDEAVLSQSYAQAQGLAVGATIPLGQRTLTVVGIANPPPGLAADVFVDIDVLRGEAGRADQVNLAFVKASQSDQVAALAQAIPAAVPGLTAAGDTELANRVSGTLVGAARLADRFVFGASAVVLAAAVAIAALLAVTSVGRRVRELGTLKAIGWKSRSVVSLIAIESLGQGIFGALLGIGLGSVGIWLLNRAGIEFSASTPALAAGTAFMGRAFGPRDGAQGNAIDIALQIDVSPTLVVLAVGLALLGALVAGGLAAWRAAGLRPADAFRRMEA